MFNVTTHSHTQTTGQGLKNALYLVMLVLAFSLYVEVHTRCIRQAFEEVEEHLGGHIANALSLEFDIPYEPGTSTQVDGDLTEAVIHGEAESVAADATLITQRMGQTLAKRKGRILNRMVFVHMEVSIAMYE